MAKNSREPLETRKPLEGRYAIDTGEAVLIADDYTPNGWVLEINGMESSHLVLDRPDLLDFEYMRWFAAIIDYYVAMQLDAEKLRITHLGGGACAMARYLVHKYPNSRNTVVELDGKLAEYVRKWFDLPRAPQLKIRVGEAREVTNGFLPQSRDILIRDVFSGFVTPEPLTTFEFTSRVQEALAVNGIYLLNCADKPNLLSARADAAALVEVFPYTCAIADAAMFKGRRRGNIVFAASNQALPLVGSNGATKILKQILGGSLPAQYKDDVWVRNFAKTGRVRRD
ncbi:MAG: fused MFS/spermidine synthase [Arcanobacterium sp.]|nr:fused MFS/spermidine synthase [Arcanobacterium sp.]